MNKIESNRNMVLRSHLKSRINVKDDYGRLNADCMIQILSFLPITQLVKLTELNSSYHRLIQSTAQLYTKIEYTFDYCATHRQSKMKAFVSVAKYAKDFSVSSVNEIYVHYKSNDISIHFKDLERILKDTSNLVSFDYGVIFKFNSSLNFHGLSFKDLFRKLSMNFFMKVSSTCTHLKALSLQTQCILVSDYINILTNLPLLTFVHFTHFFDRLIPSFELLKPQLIRIGRIQVDMDPYIITWPGDNLLASHLISINEAEVFTRMSNYVYTWNGVLSTYLSEDHATAEIAKIKALPHVKLKLND